MQLYWAIDEEWYSATVTAYDTVRNEHIVSYEDGVCELTIVSRNGFLYI